MRLLYCYIIILATMLAFTRKVSAQENYEDSLKTMILQSVKGQLNQNNFSKSFLDSLKLIPPLPVDVNSLFENVIKEISAAKAAGDIGGLGKAYRSLSIVDSMKGNYKSAYENYKLSTLYRDSLQKKELEKKELQARMQRAFDKKQAEQQLQKEKDDRKNLIQRIFLVAFLLIFITVSTTSFIAYKRERKAKKLVNVQKTELETTLTELKSTQQQLIQSEKMATLGELTAGIAHEIQNPLNFVNNFSDVNKELLSEMKTEIDKGNIDDAKAIANDVIVNEEKISHHGKRADGIVKGMLQHSRVSTGKKEQTDINALADEYLRLAYHGLRAKDNSFNAIMKTTFDESLSAGKGIDVVQQDIGRVLLNLYTNAFYAVSEKKKMADEKYEPTVSVSTKLPGSTLGDGSKVEIKVSDNGNGIPQNIVDKIFQPFFTTKPAGQGTGLGLSIAYDIITKEHNGTIKVESKDGEGTIFIIQLPISK